MRDYQKDIEVCESFNYLTAGYQCILKMALFVQNILPWYIKRCMALESQLQHVEDLSKILRKTNKYWGKMCHGYTERIFELQSQLQQAHEREAALREALEEVAGSSICKASRSIARQILSSPFLSRYREALAVVDATKNLIFALVVVGSDEVTDFHINKTKDAIVAYDKAGERSAVKQLCEDQQGNECTVHDVCAITGKRTCCLICRNSTNCEKRCEYVGHVPVND